MRRLSADLAHALAAEYVVGTLRGRARRRFEGFMRADREVAAIVRRWEDGITPLAERIAPLEPPARVWKEIESRIAPRAASPAPGASFWKSFSLVAGGLASVLLAFFVWISAAPREEPMFVAVLVASDAAPRVVVEMQEPGTMRVRVVKPWGTMDNSKQSLELWALKDGKPRSLGLVRNALGDTMIKVSHTDPRVQGAAALAVSMEPMGGSPTGQPTGNVVCSGAIAPMRKT